MITTRPVMPRRHDPERTLRRSVKALGGAFLASLLLALIYPFVHAPLDLCGCVPALCWILLAGGLACQAAWRLRRMRVGIACVLGASLAIALLVQAKATELPIFWHVRGEGIEALRQQAYAIGTREAAIAPFTCTRSGRHEWYARPGDRPDAWFEGVDRVCATLAPRISALGLREIVVSRNYFIAYYIHNDIVVTKGFVWAPSFGTLRDEQPEFYFNPMLIDHSKPLDEEPWYRFTYSD